MSEALKDIADAMVKAAGGRTPTAEELKQSRGGFWTEVSKKQNLDISWEKSHNKKGRSLYSKYKKNEHEVSKIIEDILKNSLTATNCDDEPVKPGGVEETTERIHDEDETNGDAEKETAEENSKDRFQEEKIEQEKNVGMKRVAGEELDEQTPSKIFKPLECMNPSNQQESSRECSNATPLSKTIPDENKNVKNGEAGKEAAIGGKYTDQFTEEEKEEEKNVVSGIKRVAGEEMDEQTPSKKFKPFKSMKPSSQQDSSRECSNASTPLYEASKLNVEDAGCEDGMNSSQSSILSVETRTFLYSYDWSSDNMSIPRPPPNTRVEDDSLFSNMKTLKSPVSEASHDSTEEETSVIRPPERIPTPVDLKRSFSFHIPREKWAEWRASEDHGTKLPKGWTDYFEKKFSEEGNKYCVLSFRPGRVSSPGKGQKRTPYYRARASCTHKFNDSPCMSFEFSIPKDQSDGPHLTVTVKSTGEFNHTKGQKRRRHFRRPKRLKLREELKNENATNLAKDLVLRQKTADPSVLLAGNYNNNPSKMILNKIQSEANVENYLHKDVFVDLELKTQEICEKLSEDAFPVVCKKPFIVVWQTEAQRAFLQEHQKAKQQKKELFLLHIDGTGSVVQKVDFSETKPMYYVMAVPGRNNKSPIPISECISGRHNVTTLSFWLDNACDKMTGIKYDGVVSDCSWALTHASLKTILNTNIEHYLEVAFASIQSGEEVKYPLMLWCTSHTQKTVARQTPKAKSEEDVVRRKMALHMFRELKCCTNLKDAIEIVHDFAIIFDSTQDNPNVEATIKKWTYRLAQQPDEDEDENENDVDDEGLVDDGGLDPECNRQKGPTTTKTQYSKSPFFKLFKEHVPDTVFTRHQKKKSDKAKDKHAGDKETEDKEADSAKGNTNRFYTHGLTRYLMIFLLPYLPLWSCILLHLRDKKVRKPIPNWPCENHFENVKRPPAKLHLRPSIFVDKMVNNVSKLLADVEFDPDFVRVVKRREPKDNLRGSKEVWDRRGRKNKRGAAYSPQKAAAFFSKRIIKKYNKIQTPVKKTPVKSPQKIRVTSTPINPNGAAEDTFIDLSSYQAGQPADLAAKPVVPSCATRRLSFDATPHNGRVQNAAKTRSPVKDASSSAVAVGLISDKNPGKAINEEHQERPANEILHDIAKRNESENREKSNDLGKDLKQEQQSIETESGGVDVSSRAPWKEAKYPPCLFEDNNVCLADGSPLAIVEARSVLPQKWLSGEVIDAFLSSRARIAEEKEVKVLPFDAYFLTSLQQSKTGYLNYGTRVDCLSYDIWLCPYNASEVHWALLVVLLKRKKIIYLDSKTEGKFHDDKILKLLLAFIGRMHMRKFQRPDNAMEWSISRPSDIPDQENDCDCGVHVCYWADVICSERSHTISPQECILIRPWILSEVLENVGFMPLSTPDRDKKPESVKPIRTLPCITDTPLGQYKSTLKFCKEILNSLFQGKGTKCAAGKDCKEPNSKMYFCELCREFYHIQCVNDLPSQTQAANYRCPTCKSTKARNKVKSRLTLKR